LKKKYKITAVLKVETDIIAVCPTGCASILVIITVSLISGFIGKLDMLSWMCAADKVWITELTLIHKNIRSVLNSPTCARTD
jgi:hypothetical protein